MMDALDQQVTQAFPGRVVRKDLLHQIKKGTNVPSFVLEFLLAKFCASDDADEIEAGKRAVLETLENNYVRPDEANKAQSLVQQKGKHRFIDKVHVTYNEKERRHWAEMENFNSRRIAIPEKFYKENDRLLEGGIWAEVVLAHNDVEEDDYAFRVEDLRPIQLARFDFEAFKAGRAQFNRDQWLDLMVRSLGLEPSKLTFRLKLHFLARLFSLVEANYNFIELGPRGTGKSYFFSEFSPYSTLISGGQATTSILFYNNARRKVGLVGYWDTIAFDEVASIKIKDQDSIQIMKDYMANGRFSRGKEVTANASFAFVGNIDQAVDQLVASRQFDLFSPLPEAFDLAVIDRFHYYLPGWEMPKNSSGFLTSNYGFIVDYLAEAFHSMSKSSRYDWVSSHVKLGKSIEGRDEVAIKKTLSALLKLLHPSGEPSAQELSEYAEYALEGRRRVKEQLNKRKTDEEFAKINLTYWNTEGAETEVFCPESKGQMATQDPTRKTLEGDDSPPAVSAVPVASEPVKKVVVVVKKTSEPTGPAPLKELHKKILYGDMGNSYERLFGAYLSGAKSIEIEDPYIRMGHQISNFVRFCELCAKTETIETIRMVTGSDDEMQKADAQEKLGILAESLSRRGISLKVSFNPLIHDREIRVSNGWVVKIGRGLDYFQKPEDWNAIGAQDLDLRPCLETRVDVFRNSGTNASSTTGT